MRRLGFALLLACITTVAIAWILAAFVTIPMYPRRIARDWMGSDGRVWGAAELKLPGIQDAWWNDLSSSFTGTPEEMLAAARAQHEQLAADRRGTDQHMRIAQGPPSWGSLARGRAGPPSIIGSDTAYGWPIPCLWFSVRSAGTMQTVAGIQLLGERLIGAIPIAGEPSARGRDFRALSYLVRWPALAIDLAFWTVAWWLLITIPLALRRRARRSRGRCTSCGYDLVGMTGETCPECGVAAT